MNEYIPVHEYAKCIGTSKQNVYRWVREGKLKDFKIEEIITKRIRIKRP